MSEQRTCITCGKTKPLTEFYLEKRTGNYQNKCLEWSLDNNQNEVSNND